MTFEVELSRFEHLSGKGGRQVGASEKAFEEFPRQSFFCLSSGYFTYLVGSFVPRACAHQNNLHIGRLVESEGIKMSNPVAEQYKAKGNSFYSSGDYARAVECYTQAIST